MFQNNMKYLIVIGFCLMVPIVFAPQQVLAEEEVQINVTAIMASSEATYVDPDLEFIADEFESFFSYSSFRKISSYTVLLKEGSSDRIILPHDQNLVISYNGIEEDNIGLHIKLGDFLNTECTMVDGGHILVGGPHFESGVLILLFEAKK